MAEDCDEEVVFRDSPLYQYLQDVGVTDFELADPVSVKERLENDGGGKTSPSDRTSWPSLLERIRLKFSVAAACLWEWWPLLVREEVDDTCRRQVVSCILSSSALLHDDLKLIDLFAPGAITESGGEPHRCKSDGETHGVTWFSAACLAVLAVMIAIFSVHKTYPSTWLLLTLLLILVTTCVALTQLLKKWFKRKKLLMSQEELQQLVHGIEQLGSLAGRAIRFVQESEVIARGFTLSTADLPTRVLDSGVRAKLQHTELRQSLYQAVRLALLALRQATADMLKSYPIDAEVDNLVNFLLNVPLGDLGLGLAHRGENLTEELVLEETEDYSLQALKVLRQLYLAQASEYLRHLALLLFIIPSSLAFHQYCLPRLLFDLIPGPAPTVMAAHQSLDCDYERERRRWTRRLTLASAQKGAERMKQHGEQFLLASALRSLQHHLAAAAQWALETEDELEQCAVSDKPTIPSRELSARLGQIEPHLDAGKACWEEATLRLRRILGAKPSDSGQTKILTTTQDGHYKQPPTRTTNVSADKNPVPEDEEFEALVELGDEGEDRRCRPRGDLQETMAEEKERECQERQEARRMLQELRSVLGWRTSQEERSIRNRLLYPAAVSAVHPFEPRRDNNESGVGLLKESCEMKTDSENMERTDTNEETAGEVLHDEDKDGEVKPSQDMHTVTKDHGGCKMDVAKKPDRSLEDVEMSRRMDWNSKGLALTVPHDRKDDNGKPEKNDVEHEGEVMLAINSHKNKVQEGELQPLEKRCPGFLVPGTECHNGVYNQEQISIGEYQGMHFASILAAQAVAHSRVMAPLHEQTFGDDDDDSESDAMGLVDNEEL
uniref:vezatin n=1 Tax=Myxine glutinosa TaxID=7769 RepID=UPI00358F3E57